MSDVNIRDCLPDKVEILKDHFLLYDSAYITLGDNHKMICEIYNIISQAPEMSQLSNRMASLISQNVAILELAKRIQNTNIMVN